MLIIKWPRKQLLNSAAIYGNVLTMSYSGIVTTSETDVATILILDRATTFSQRQSRRCDNAVKTSLCQLGFKSCLNFVKLIFDVISDVALCSRFCRFFQNNNINSYTTDCCNFWLSTTVSIFYSWFLLKSSWVSNYRLISYFLM